MSKKETELEIHYLDPKKILPADYNPRGISTEAYAGLLNSIKEFGIVDPFIINKKSGLLVGGHQRLKASIELKLKKVPVVYVELDPIREKILNVTLNNPKISGHYTKDLQEVLNEISAKMPEFSFDDLRMSGLEHLIVSNEWNSNIGGVDKTKENLDGLRAKIKITCPTDLKDEVLIYIKAKLLETSFEGVHVE